MTLFLIGGIHLRLKVLDLFAGKGAFVSALKELGVEVEIIGFSEILSYAQESYRNIHNVDDSVNLGDVTKVKELSLPVFDIIVSGSPCQSFTNEGTMEGGNKGSGTRSSLLWEQIDIAAIYNPKYIVWENVRGLNFKRNSHILPQYMTELNLLGYNTYYKLLDSYDYNSVQKRERYFVVSIRKDIDNGTFEFPLPVPNKVKLLDKLEPYNEKYSIKQMILNEMVLEKLDVNKYKIKNATKQGYLIAEEGDGIDFSFPTSKTRRGRVQKGACQTIKTQVAIGTIQDDKFRWLTPLEYWRVQDFKDEEYYKAVDAGCTEKQLYSLAGNSINQNVLKALFKELLKIK